MAGLSAHIDHQSQRECGPRREEGPMKRGSLLRARSKPAGSLAGSMDRRGGGGAAHALRATRRSLRSWIRGRQPRPTPNHAMFVLDTLYGLDRDLTPQPQKDQLVVVPSSSRPMSTLTLREGLRSTIRTPVLGRDIVSSVDRSRRGTGTDGFPGDDG